MNTIEKLYAVNETIFFVFAILMTMVPFLFFLGHIFKKEGRRAVIENPFIACYFLIYFTYAYFFWIEPETFLSYIHIGNAGMNVAYWVVCVGAFFEKSGPMGA